MFSAKNYLLLRAELSKSLLTYDKIIKYSLCYCEIASVLPAVTARMVLLYFNVTTSAYVFS